VQIQKRAQELSESSQGGAVGAAEQEEDHDSVLKRLRAVLNRDVNKDNP
jgi:hypothetical protein